MPLLEVVTRTSDAYLTTTAAVKLALGTTSTADDVRLDFVIRAASAWAQQVVGYPLTLQRYREAVESYGTRSLMVARTPVRSIFSLYETTSTENADNQIASSDFAVDHGAGLLRRAEGWIWNVPTEQRLSARPLPGQEYPGWLVDYTAGYCFGLDTGSSLWSTAHGTTSTGRTLPEDIEQAVIAKAVGLFDGSDEVTEEAVGDLRVRYGSYGSGGERGKTVAELLLEPYRRIV